MIVQKGNTQYRIGEEQKESYLEQGFSVVNEQGEVIEKPTNIAPEDAMQELEIAKKELAKETADHIVTSQQLVSASSQIEQQAAEIEELKKKVK